LISVSTGVAETDELYGITVRCAPIFKLSAVALSDFGDELMLSLKLKRGLEWKTLFERVRVHRRRNTANFWNEWTWRCQSSEPMSHGRKRRSEFQRLSQLSAAHAIVHIQNVRFDLVACSVLWELRHF